MPWPREYKARTRERIVAAAAAALRRSGPSGVGVAEIMSNAGLTHGGFYAHFASKDELLAAAFDRAGDETLAMMDRTLAAAAPEARLRAVIEAYLSPRHMANVDGGCPVPAVGSEAVREGSGVRSNLRRMIRHRIAWLRNMIVGGRPSARERQAVAVLACMVGGVMLARAVGGKESEALLKACREFLLESLQSDAAPRNKARSRSPGPQS